MTGGPSTPLGVPVLALQAAAAWSGLAERLWPGAASLTAFERPLPMLVAGDPQQAHAFYRGRFAFAGHKVRSQPAALFELAAPSDGWTRAVHGFTWLSHLEAAELALYRAYARTLLLAGAARGLDGELDTVVERVIAFCRHGRFLLSGASARFEQAFLRTVNADVQRLTQARVRTPLDALKQSAATLAATLSFTAPPALRSVALARTAAAADASILPDGGPADRSPRTLAQVLGLLVALRSHIASQRLAIPHELNAAIERGTAMLRLLCFDDGGLVTFQGVDGSCLPLVKAILARDETAGRPLVHAPHSGFARLQQQASAVIIDCGGPSGFDSMLAIEFAEGAQRIVTSCGVPPHAPPAWALAARGVAAHSTLQLGGEESRGLAAVFRRKPRVPQVSADVLTTPHGVLFKSRSLRHAASAGIVHLREVFLSAHGGDVRGEDRFELADGVERAWPESEFALRFHLHPDVWATADAGGRSVSLALAGGGIWQFTARGGTLALEDSLFVATGSTPRPCRQMVIRGCIGRPDIVNWAFRKLPG